MAKVAGSAAIQSYLDDKVKNMGQAEPETSEDYLNRTGWEETSDEYVEAVDAEIVEDQSDRRSTAREPEPDVDEDSQDEVFEAARFAHEAQRPREESSKKPPEDRSKERSSKQIRQDQEEEARRREESEEHTMLRKLSEQLKFIRDQVSQRDEELKAIREATEAATMAASAAAEAAAAASRQPRIDPRMAAMMGVRGNGNGNGGRLSRRDQWILDTELEKREKAEQRGLSSRMLQWEREQAKKQSET
jgi:hypothetical protein